MNIFLKPLNPRMVLVICSFGGVVCEWSWRCGWSVLFYLIGPSQLRLWDQFVLMVRAIRLVGVVFLIGPSDM